STAYLSAVDTEVKVVFSLVPRPETTVMMATEMPAAIRPYSMAVAPLSSLANCAKSFVMSILPLPHPCGNALLPQDGVTIGIRRYDPLSAFDKIVTGFAESARGN